MTSNQTEERLDGHPTRKKTLHQADVLETLREIARANANDGIPLKELFEYHARKLHTSPTALRGHWSRMRGEVSHKIHATRILSRFQEDTLRYSARVFSACNRPLRRADVQKIALSLWKIPLERGAVKRWLKREKDDHTSALRTDSLEQQAQADLHSYLTKLGTLYEKVPFAQCVFRTDETLVTFTESGISFERPDWPERAGAPQLRTTGQEQSATLLAFLSADGRVLFSLYIFRTNADQESVPFVIRPAEQTRTDCWPRFFAFSETGLITKDIWSAVVAYFCNRVALLRPILPALLLSDQRASNREPMVIATAYEKQVFVWSLVINRNRFLRPLDSLPSLSGFKPYATELQTTRVFNDRPLSVEGVNLLLEAALQAEMEVFNSSAIKSSFVSTGLFPFNKDALQSRLARNSTTTASTSSCSSSSSSSWSSSPLPSPSSSSSSSSWPILESRMNFEFEAEEQVERTRIKRGRWMADSVFSLLKAAAAEEEEEEEQAQRLPALTCRADGCPATDDGAQGWPRCLCSAVVVCPEHRDLASLATFAKKQRVQTDETAALLATTFEASSHRGGSFALRLLQGRQESY